MPVICKACRTIRLTSPFPSLGAMFAPKPFDVAREMVRVTKPGESRKGARAAGKSRPETAAFWRTEDVRCEVVSEEDCDGELDSE